MMASLRTRVDDWLDSRAPPVPTIGLSERRRLDLLARHGDFSLAYSTATQAGLSYFGDEDGYIAFQTKMGRHFVLADPVADPAARAGLLARFVEAAGAPWFVQVGARTAETLAGLGYLVNRMGFDTALPLPASDFSGKRNETVRYSERWLGKKGFTLAEDDGTLVSPADVEALSAEWRSGRIVSRREMAFLNRPFLVTPGPLMRRFVLLDGDRRLVALLDYDPMFRDGEVVGYTTAFKRKVADATPHAEVGLTKFSVDRFRAEGVPAVTLGLSPLADIGPSGFAESALWRSAFERAFRSGFVNRTRFNLQGQAAFKRRFHGHEEPVYIAFPKGSAFGMLALLRLVKAI
jgi:lysylphosphatidylglycerol synthetase-like protein (DUF2156 family)